jgi:Reverse transcriptase (RNA-dependent DNA polymerase)
LVASGYSQVPGVDFNESVAPVINDVSFRVMLIIKLTRGMQATIIDVETAFLHGNLQEEIYMNIPDGLDSNSKSDPCLLSKWEDGEVILIGIYVDDCLVIGKENQISMLITDLKNGGFNLKITQNLTDYLSCRVLENQAQNEILILQPHLINNLRDKFEDEVFGKGTYKAPGTPRFKVVRPDENSELIDDNLQKRFRSGVGMLLYLTKHSCPDLCHVVRELSKCMDGESMGTFLELLRVIKFVLDTKNICLKIQPKFDDSS